MTIAMGVDVGGTKIAAGLVDESGEILQMTRVETPATDVSQIAEAIGGACRELASCHEVEAIGIGAAGFVDAKRENVVFSANLAWREEPLARRVAEHIPCRKRSGLARSRMLLMCSSVGTA